MNVFICTSHGSSFRSVPAGSHPVIAPPQVINPLEDLMRKVKAEFPQIQGGTESLETHAWENHGKEAPEEKVGSRCISEISGKFYSVAVCFIYLGI